MHLQLIQWLGLLPRTMPLTHPNPALLSIARNLISGQLPDCWQLLCSSAKARVAKGAWKGRQVYLKIFLQRGFFEGLKSLGRGSRGVRFVDRSIQMNLEGFHTPPVLAYGRDASRLEYVLTEAVPYPAMIDLLTCTTGMYLLSLPERHKLLRVLGAEIARLHMAGWIHGDLQLSNLLCNHANGIHSEFWYLDNEGNHRSFSVRQQRRNLVQLIMTQRELQSRNDQLRILRGYAEAMGLDRNDYRKLLRQVEADRTRRWKRRMRSGGPKRRFHPARSILSL
jgi:tRNA A-37 threonylcarbamoyl transferase component Bud32